MAEHVAGLPQGHRRGPSAWRYRDAGARGRTGTVLSASVPGLGYTREQQEHIQQLARHLLNYHEAFRAYKIAFSKTALASLESVQKRRRMMHEAGQKIESLRALYDMWVDASEEATASSS